jgi:hypothetical protein
LNIAIALDFLLAAFLGVKRLVLAALSNAEYTADSDASADSGALARFLRRDLKADLILTFFKILNSRFLSEERRAFLADDVFGIIILFNCFGYHCRGHQCYKIANITRVGYIDIDNRIFIFWQIPLI